MLWLADRFSRALADRIVYRQFAGLSVERLRADAMLCRDTLLLPACFDAALAEMEAHRRAGRRLVLVTGGIDIVLAPLAARLGADLLAQRLETCDGRFTGRHLGYAGVGDGTATKQGARKEAALRLYASCNGIDLARSYAFGDSVNDIPMLSAVGRPIAVNADRKLRREAARRGWECREWRLSRDR